MERFLVLENHQVVYGERGDPLWFILLLTPDGDRIDIILVEAGSEDDARSSLAGRGEILKVVQLWSLLDRLRIVSGFIREIG